MTLALNFPQPLCEKYRPRTINEFIGLAKPKKILQSFIQKPFDSAWLFLGPSGTGKTTMAMALARQINAEIHHIPSRSCDLETVQNVTRMCLSAGFNFKTGKACSYHAVICDEADQMTMPAQLAFLSKLDSTDAPPQTVFFFTANSTLGLEPRFLSRCRMLVFEPESLTRGLARYLKRVYKSEGGTYPVDFTEIALVCENNVRDALGRLEIELMLHPRKQ